MCGCVRVLRIGKPLRKSWQRRLFSSSSTPPPVQGVPYTKLSVGVPKEVWQDERRFVTNTNHYLEIPFCFFCFVFTEPCCEKLPSFISFTLWNSASSTEIGSVSTLCVVKLVKLSIFRLSIYPSIPM